MPHLHVPQTAVAKTRAAEDAWNTRDPARIALAYTPDTRWRNRAEFVTGREQVVAFLSRKWDRELEYRLIKEVWAHSANRIAVRFVYEYRDDSNNWCAKLPTSARLWAALDFPRAYVPYHKLPRSWEDASDARCAKPPVSAGFGPSSILTCPMLLP
jgi:hypothetical protein